MGDFISRIAANADDHMVNVIRTMAFRYGLCKLSNELGVSPGTINAMRPGDEVVIAVACIVYGQ